MTAAKLVTYDLIFTAVLWILAAAVLATQPGIALAHKSEPQLS